LYFSYIHDDPEKYVLKEELFLLEKGKNSLKTIFENIFFKTNFRIVNFEL